MGFQTARLVGHRIKIVENFQNRLRTKHLVKNLKEDTKLVKEIIPMEIEQKHLVEEGLKHEDEVAEHLQGDVKGSNILFRNVFLDEDKELNFLITNEGVFHSYYLHSVKSLKDWKDNETAKRIKESLDQLSLKFNKEVYGDMQNRETYLRAQYKDFINLIQAAEHGETTTMMEEIKSLWKKEDASYLDYYLIKFELKRQLKKIGTEKKDIMKLLRLYDEVEKDISGHKKTAKLSEKDIKLLNSKISGILKGIDELGHVIKSLTKQVHLALKRIILLDFSVLALAAELVRDDQRWKQAILIPTEKADEEIKEIREGVFKDLDKTIREYAQAIRIELRQADKALKLVA